MWFSPENRNFGCACSDFEETQFGIVWLISGTGSQLIFLGDSIVEYFYIEGMTVLGILAQKWYRFGGTFLAMKCWTCR